MCIICIEFNNDRLGIEDARRNLREMVEDMDEEHLREVQDMLDAAEDEDQDGN